MLKSVLSLWLVGALFVPALAQVNLPQFTNTMDGQTTASSTTTSSETTPLRATPVSSSTSNKDPDENGDSAASSTLVQGSNTVAVTAATGTNDLPSTAATLSAGAANGQQSDQAESDSAPTSQSSGISSTEKIGIGVGVGLGVPLIVGAIALIFFLRRRRRNQYNSGQSAAQYRDQPAMSSGAPALAGVSAMGRSPSNHSRSLPHTPSQHSLANIPPPEPTIIPPSQHSLAKAPSEHSIPPPSPQEDTLRSPPPQYEEAPSPMEEYEPEPISPVSPVSPIFGSRPPSPLNEHDSR